MVVSLCICVAIPLLGLALQADNFARSLRLARKTWKALAFFLAIVGYLSPSNLAHITLGARRALTQKRALLWYLQATVDH